MDSKSSKNNKNNVIDFNDSASRKGYYKYSDGIQRDIYGEISIPSAKKRKRASESRTPDSKPPSVDSRRKRATDTDGSGRRRQTPPTNTSTAPQRKRSAAGSLRQDTVRGAGSVKNPQGTAETTSARRGSQGQATSRRRSSSPSSRSNIPDNVYRLPQGQRSTNGNRQRPANNRQRPLQEVPPKRPVRKKVKSSNPPLVFSVVQAVMPVTYNRDATGYKRIKKSNRDERNSTFFGVFILISVLITVYITGYFFSNSNKSTIEYSTVDLGAVSSPKKATGLIVRSETVYTAPSGGNVEYMVANGEKVKNGDVVCTVSNAKTVAKIQANLDTINENIMKLQAGRKDISRYTEEVKRLNNQMIAFTEENAFDLAEGNFSGVYNLKFSVENKLDNRNRLLLSENSDSLSSLVGQRKSELDQIDSNTAKVSVNSGGILSYMVDGSEASFTTENIPSVTKDQINSLKAQTSGIATSVASGDPVFKLVNSNKWYLVSYMPQSYTEGWETGSKRTLYLPNGVEESRPVEAQIVTLEPRQKDSFVVFLLNDYMLDYVDIRTLTFETDQPKSGYKIPTSAITQRTNIKVPSEFVDNDTKTVVKVKDNKNIELPITPSGTIDDNGTNYTLVLLDLGQLAPGDVLKMGDKTFTTNDVITADGVYLANSGSASFVHISLEGAVTQGDYTVLDKNKNPDLHIYDRIVANAKNVTEDQKIYE